MATSLALLITAAFLLCVIGLLLKMWHYWKTPAPLKIAVTPAPTTSAGVFYRMFREVIFFESLFKSNKWIWVFGYLFHFAMLLVLVRHLRYFTEPVWTWVEVLQPFGKYAGFAMAFGITCLWARRFLVDRVRYISSLSDHLMLALLLGIVLSGLGMTYVAHTDVISVKSFALGLLVFDWQPLTMDLLLLVHLSLVVILLAIFPFSKLLHVPGVFFSPTRNQSDNARNYRHLADWAAKLDHKN